MECYGCDQHSARVAELVVQLRKAARDVHRLLGHATTNALDCLEVPCRDHARVALAARRT